MITSKGFKYLSVVLIILILISSCKTENITQYVPVENYPEDTAVQSITNKNAMIINDHDDDMCTASGTLDADKYCFGIQRKMLSVKQ